MGLASHGFAVREDLIEERLCVNYARDLRFVPLDPICGEMQDFIQEFVEGNSALVLQILLQIGFVMILKILRVIGVVTSRTLTVGSTVDCK
jgi:hypothetical protein